MIQWAVGPLLLANAMCLILGPLLLILSVFLNLDRTVDSNSGSAVIAARMAVGTGLSPVDFFIMVTEVFKGHT